ncbi:DUF418 domain-containing protein [Neobacillus sp. PS3-34]|uniref:DUF418 domain-containing protein n=1 Tax=Neobacillus sp. PS3-34 TaxID=3070678 RepID=UPI0027DEB0D1|nr:DUF418 domain-containing protein [Neobacillus sp. PS3-34]WML49619.1 DUF418 domain-containing protein [Neobacillus sp. PS3-34]
MAETRNLYLDVLRGFSVMGILFVNMLSFHSPFLYIDPISWWDKPIDRTVFIVIDIFFQGSFFPIFSFLFGVGLSRLREKAFRQGDSFYWIAVRRLTFLLLLGIIHAFLIWHGDILIQYAVIGCISLVFLTLPPKKIMSAGIMFYTIPNILLSLLAFFDSGQPRLFSNSKAAAVSLEIYRHGSFQAITVQRIHDWAAANNFFSLVLLFTTILPFFLIGVSLANSGWLERRYDTKKVFFAFFVTGILIKCLPYLIGWSFAAHFVQDIFGGPILGASYAAGIFGLMQKKTFLRFFKVFSPVGRMSLTNYLFQSIVSTLIFYHYGLGYYGQSSVLNGTLLAAGLFTFELLVSHYWVKRFYNGR